MDEAHQLPVCHQRRLAFHDVPEQAQVGCGGVGQLGKMAADGVIGQGPEPIVFAPGRGIFEGSHAQVTGGHTGEDGPGQRCFAIDRLPGGHHRKAAGGGDAQRVKGLADDVLPEHGAQGGPPVPTA